MSAPPQPESLKKFARSDGVFAVNSLKDYLKYASHVARGRADFERIAPSLATHVL
jgi:hypothetical protein